MGHIALLLHIVGELLCEAVDLRVSDRVLDVVARAGDASLVAALRIAEVVSSVQMFEAGGARHLKQGAFDVALSTFGVMFTPHPRRVAEELLRLVKPGGRMGLAIWARSGFSGELLELMERFAPPEAGLSSPRDWGVEARLVERFQERACEIQTTRKTYVFHYLSPEHWMTFSGSTTARPQGLSSSYPGRRRSEHSRVFSRSSIAPIAKRSSSPPTTCKWSSGADEHQSQSREARRMNQNIGRRTNDESRSSRPTQSTQMRITTMKTEMVVKQAAAFGRTGRVESVRSRGWKALQVALAVALSASMIGCYGAPTSPQRELGAMGALTLRGQAVQPEARSLRSQTEVFEGACDIAASLGAFRDALGTLNPNQPVSFGSGRREINWDAVPAQFTNADNFPADFFNQPAVGRARGAVFSTPGSAFRVSDRNFDDINPTYADQFHFFSPGARSSQGSR
jgi:SAM-dependent methyltransferase